MSDYFITKNIYMNFITIICSRLFNTLYISLISIPERVSYTNMPHYTKSKFPPHISIPENRPQKGQAMLFSSDIFISNYVLFPFE